ncbi:hypothetical protein ZWY2020_011295 [Hordeum vulgare]|nr:hypothetical protein ZWY2020_011295 [Hordeum vulgare]
MPCLARLWWAGPGRPVWPGLVHKRKLASHSHVRLGLTQNARPAPFPTQTQPRKISHPRPGEHRSHADAAAAANQCHPPPPAPLLPAANIRGLCRRCPPCPASWPRSPPLAPPPPPRHSVEHLLGVHRLTTPRAAAAAAACRSSPRCSPDRESYLPSPTPRPTSPYPSRLVPRSPAPPSRSPPSTRSRGPRFGRRGGAQALPLSEGSSSRCSATARRAPRRRRGSAAPPQVLRLVGRRPPVPPHARRVPCRLRLLSRARRASVVLDWLRLFAATSASTGPPRFPPTLVVGYAVAGDPQRGLSVLGRMRFRGLDLAAVSARILLHSLVDASFRLSRLLRPQPCCWSRCNLHPHQEPLPPRHSSAMPPALLDTLPFAEASEAPLQALLSRSSVGVGALARQPRLLANSRHVMCMARGSMRYDKLVHRLLRKNRLGEVYDLLVEMMEEGIAQAVQP